MSSQLATVGQSPVEVIDKHTIEAAVKRMKVIVKDGDQMSTEELTVIAQDAILTRSMPGRDVHWFKSKGKLMRVDDYKRLVAWATERERFLTGDPQASFEDRYDPLTPTDFAREGVSENDVATYCTITTSRERDLYRHEIAEFIKLGLDPAQAIEAADKTLGDIGTQAIGVVRATDGNIPQGWSKLHKAKKLALKNAINMKYGNPSIDELQAMTKSMARIETVGDDWVDVPIDEPAEIQAKHAELNAIAREGAERQETIPADELQAEAETNVNLMRGEDIATDPIEPDEPKQEYRFPNDEAKLFWEGIQWVTNEYFKSPFHLLQVVTGGKKWFDTTDKDTCDAMMSIATDHVEAKAKAVDHAAEGE